MTAEEESDLKAMAQEAHRLLYRIEGVFHHFTPSGLFEVECWLSRIAIGDPDIWNRIEKEKGK